MTRARVRYVNGPLSGETDEMQRSDVDSTVEEAGYRISRDTAGVPMFDRDGSLRAIYVQPKREGSPEA